ncbi:MAG: asparagine synthase (glutamine-hydrolyzing) [Elusimicrobia bacterium]|nr:asparagine synthase (glutamine-hydrolyzing) [Elusimicrobiota bacterium]
MCGICGILDLGGAPDRRDLGNMRRALLHRGPDDEGEHRDGPAALGFQRLSILDLEGGHQPFLSRDGRVALVFNGEIYNHPELREELERGGVRFRTRSDTETLLELYLQEGAAAFKRLNGMFAVGLWDGRSKELLLARDPVGIKPLYYHFDGRRLLFSSELRSLLKGGIKAGVNSSGLLEYLLYGKVHAPRTIIEGVLKLPPGHTLKLGAGEPRLEGYWDWPWEAAESELDFEEALEVLDRVLSEAVRAAMLSDVSLGAFLSGGVDSSLIAAYMARHSPGKVSTFSVGFSGAASGVDESNHARRVAKHLGTDHHELILKAGVLEGLEGSIQFLDEPIADSAILPTYLLAQFARGKVKVALTGEGADELFAGYNRHKAAWLNEKLVWCPAGLGLTAAPLARRLGKGRIFAELPYASVGDWARASASSSLAELREFLAPDFWALCSSGTPLWSVYDGLPMRRLDSALGFDFKTVLCDSLLMKADKATMKASLEARVPFLNLPVVEFAAKLPSSFKIRRFRGKYILRRLAEKYLPLEIAWRSKHGFIVPWESWVRNPGNPALRGFGLGGEGAAWFFNKDAVRRGHGELARGSRRVEAGLFFRIAVLGLWLDSLENV